MRPTMRGHDLHVRPRRRLARRALLAGLLAASVLVPAGTGALAGQDEAIAEQTDGEVPAEPAPPGEGDVTLTVEGVIEQIMVEPLPTAGDAVGWSDEEISTLLDVDGTLYQLPEELTVEGETGDELVVTIQADAEMSVEAALEEIAVTERGDTASVLSALPAQSGVSAAVEDGTMKAAVGTHTLTVLPVYWGSPDVSTDTLSSVATATAQYWNGQSGGRLAIQPAVRPWAKIADPGSCSTTTLWNSALAAHRLPAPGPTDHVLVYFPKRADCGGWAGQAGLNSSKIWVNGAPLVDVAAHELGHNFGLGHANTMTCTVGGARVPFAAPASSSCTKQDYGDWTDVMGIGTNLATGNLNSAFADYLGFASVTDVGASPASSVQQLAPLGNVFGMRALKVPTAEGTVYMDYRPAVAPDVRKPAWAGVQVRVRRMENNIPTTYLLDMQAQTAGSFAAPALPVGQSWVVPGTTARLGVSAVGGTATIGVSPSSVPFDDGIDRYIRRVYSDLFNRQVDAGGLSTWGMYLRAGTPRVEVANSITYSAEYRVGLIQKSYQRYLGRAAEQQGLDNWLRNLAAGYTIQQMEAGFIASDEYYGKAGGTDAGWVTAMYRSVLGRSPGPAEVDQWVRVARSGAGRSDIAMGFLLSTEHLTSLVDGYYWQLLRRGIDPTGSRDWVAAVQGGARVEAIIGGIVASTEYYARP